MRRPRWASEDSRQARRDPAATARRAVSLAAVLALLAQPQALVRQGESMQDGVTRTATLAVARPLSRLSTTLRLEQTTTHVLAWLHLGAGAGTGLSDGTGTGPLLLAPPVPAVPRAGAGAGERRDQPRDHLQAGSAAAPPPRQGAAATPPSAPLARPSPQHPLRLLITGDSLVGYLGPALAASLVKTGVVQPTVDFHNGTGLTRPGFVDWAALAQRQVRAWRPDAVVMMLGANDDIGMPTPSGHVAAEGSAAWAAEYQRRLRIVLGILTQQGHAQVYWLTLPMAREARRSHDYALINRAAHAVAATLPGVHVVEVGEWFTPGGHYRDAMPVDGHQEIVREPDGVHLNLTGSRVAAGIVQAVLRHDYALPSQEATQGT
jgi:hypothetical protein